MSFVWREPEGKETGPKDVYKRQVIGKLKVIKLQILTHMPQKLVGSHIL